MARHGFVFTLNNWTPEQRVKLQGAVGVCGVKYIVMGEEIAPSTGTPHLQGYLQANHDIKNRFHKSFEIFVAKQMGTSEQASEYCKKDGTFFEAGEMEHIDAPKKRQGARNDLKELQDAIDKGMTYDEICDTHFETAAKFHKFIKDRVQARDSNRQVALSRERYESASMRPWQQAMMDVCAEDANPRGIHWIWETAGGTGKSWFANYMGCLHGATILTNGKKVDMAYIYAQKPTKIVFFDLSRTTAPTEDKQHFLDGVYSLAEDMKNGRVVSTKYESRTVFFEVPHVIFLANFPPDMTKWSDDRYLVKNI